MGGGGFQQVGVQATISGLQQFVAGANQVQSSLNNMNAAATRAAQGQTSSWGAVRTAAAAGTAAIVAGAVAATGALTSLAGVTLTVATRYEDTMVKVQVLSRSTAGEMGQLDDALYRIGTTSRISMQEAAEGATELAKAGMTVKDQVGGALQAVVDFTQASAGEVGMAEAAITVAKALSVWGLEGTEAARVSNALTGAAQGSVLSYKDLTRSFQQAANVSALLGLSVEDLSTTLAVFGQAGLRGSDAGTSLKQMFIELLSPSKDALELMKQYNISLFDTEGKVRPFRDVIQGLEEAFGQAAVATGKITEAERAHALAVIFGSDAIRAAIVSANFGTAAWDKMNKVIKDTSASDIANLFLKSTTAQIDILTNRLLAGASVLGGVFLDSLRGTVTWLNVMAASISKKDIQDFGQIVLHQGARLMVAADAAKDYATGLLTVGRAAANSTPAMLGLAVASSMFVATLVTPTVIRGVGLLAGGFAAMAGGAAAAGRGLLVLAVGIRAVGASATVAAAAVAGRAALAGAFSALAVAIMTPTVMIGGLLSLLVIFSADIGEVRTTVIRMAGLIEAGMRSMIGAIKSAFVDMAAMTYSSLADILRATNSFLQQLPGIQGLIGASLSSLADSMAASAEHYERASWDIRRETEQNSLAAIEGAAEWKDWADTQQAASAASLTFSGSLKDIMKDILDVDGALGGLNIATDDYGEIADVTGGKVGNLAAEIERDMAAALAKAQEEAEGLGSTVGGTLPGSFEEFDDAADKAGKSAKKLKTFLDLLGVSADTAKKFFEALGFSSGETMSALMALGESAADAAPEIGDLGLTTEQGIAILLRLGYTLEEATFKVNALSAALQKQESIFEKIGISIEGARDLLKELGNDEAAIEAKLTSLGVHALDARGGLKELSIGAEEGTKLLEALGMSGDDATAALAGLEQTLRDRKAMEQAKQDAEEARSKFEELRNEMIALSDTITGSLQPALTAYFASLNAGAGIGVTSALGANVTTILEGIGRQTGRVPSAGGAGAFGHPDQVPTLDQIQGGGFAEFAGGGEIGQNVAGILGTMVQNLSGISAQFAQADTMAQTASKSFTAAAQSLTALNAIGGDFTAAIGTMRNSADSLGASLVNLEAADLAAAGALMDAYNALILQAEAAKGDAEALKVVQAGMAALQPEMDRLAAKSDEIRQKQAAAVKETAGSLIKFFQENMNKEVVSALDNINQSIASFARDRWLKSMADEANKAMEEIADALNKGLDPSEAIAKAMPRLQSYQEQLNKINAETERLEYIQTRAARAMGDWIISLGHQEKALERVRTETERATLAEERRIAKVEQGIARNRAQRREQNKQFLEGIPKQINDRIDALQEMTKFTQGREATFNEIFGQITQQHGMVFTDQYITEDKPSATTLARKAVAQDAIMELLQGLGYTLSDVKAYYDSLPTTYEDEFGNIKETNRRNRPQIRPPSMLGTPLLNFAGGGTIPGAEGEPRLIWGHGKELVTTPSQIRSLETTLPRNIARELAPLLRNAGNTSYVVNANYQNMQSPASLDMDMRAIVALTR